LPLAIFATSPATPQPKTAAVIAVDEGWDKAEDTGDTAYNLLLPDYRSVNAVGSVHDKAAILSSAKKNVSSPDHAVKVAKWKAAHPMGTLAMVHGDTAIVTFYLKPLGPEKGSCRAISSCTAMDTGTRSIRSIRMRASNGTPTPSPLPPPEAGLQVFWMLWLKEPPAAYLLQPTSCSLKMSKEMS
jgi:hypothetical protein